MSIKRNENTIKVDPFEALTIILEIVENVSWPEMDRLLDELDINEKTLKAAIKTMNSFREQWQ